MFGTQVAWWQSAAVAASISVGTPVFQNFAASTSPWDLSYTFAGTENLLLVPIAYESNQTVASVTIDPDGDNISMTEVVSIIGASNVTRVAIWGVYDFTPQSGAKTIRVVHTSFGTNGAFGVYPFFNATKLPATGDGETDTSNSASATTHSLSITATGKTHGYVVCGLCTNNTPATTADQDLTQDHTYSGAADGQRNSFGLVSPTLADPAIPRWTWTGNQRSAMAGALAT